MTTDGTQVGRVTDVLHQAANDILNVQTSRGDRLIPLTGNVVRSIDPGHTIEIEPLPGLLEDDG